MYEFNFLSSDGETKLHALEWLPEDAPKGILQIVHGLAGHMARYADFAETMARNGCIVVGHDHPGRGETPAGGGGAGLFGERGGWELAVDDVRRLTELSHRRHSGLPLYLLGHSTGSLLARAYITEYRQGLDGVLLSGTGQAPAPLSFAGEALAKLEIRRHGPRCRSERLYSLIFGRHSGKIFSPKAASGRLGGDEAIAGSGADGRVVPSAALFLDVLRGMRRCGGMRNLKRMKKDLPVYFFSGDMDPFGGYGKGVLRVYRSFLAAGMRDVSLKLYPGGRHEMLNGQNREEVCADVLAWIESKSGRK